MWPFREGFVTIRRTRNAVAATGPDASAPAKEQFLLIDVETFVKVFENTDELASKIGAISNSVKAEWNHLYSSPSVSILNS